MQANSVTLSTCLYLRCWQQWNAITLHIYCATGHFPPHYHCDPRSVLNLCQLQTENSSQHSWLRIQGLFTSVATQNWLSTAQLPHLKTTSNTTDKTDSIPGRNSVVTLSRREESRGSRTKFHLKSSAIIKMLVPSLLHASIYMWALNFWKAAPSHTGSATITPSATERNALMCILMLGQHRQTSTQHQEKQNSQALRGWRLRETYR